MLTYSEYPQQGDYIQLLDENNLPCENFTFVDTWLSKLGEQLYLVCDQQGENYAIARDPDLDTCLRAGWQQVITATG